MRDYFAEEVEGQIATIPKGRDYFAEEVEAPSTNKPFLPKRQQVQEEIARRPGSIRTVVSSMPKMNLATLLDLATKGPMGALTSLASPAVAAAAVPLQRVESAVAAPALEAQSGNLNFMDLLRASGRGLIGKDQAQLGDVIRTTGFGGKANEVLAGTTGLLGAGALGVGMAKGASALAPKVAPIATKAGQAVGKAAGAPVRFAKNVARRSAANYITDDVAPQAHAVYQDSIKKFTPQIQQFAKEELKIPETAIKTISKSGVDDVMATAEKYGNSTDPIYQKVEQGFVNKENSADRVYQAAMDSAPEGRSINIRPAIEESGRRLKSLGLITENGNLTQLGRSEISRDSVYGKLLDFYKSADSISGVKNLQGKPLTQGQMIKASKALRETLVNKDQYTFLRDKLNSLYKNKPSDVDVSKVVNRFYADGEASGIKGLQQARGLQRQAFQARENLYRKGLIAEKKLDRFQTLSAAEKRQLSEIEKYIGEPFVDDLDKLTAAQELQKFDKYDLGNFQRELSEAVDPKWTMTRFKEYKSLLGEKNAMDIFREVVAHRKAVKLKTAVKFVGGAAIGGGVAKGIFDRFTK
jgi:hypothetical protein